MSRWDEIESRWDDDNLTMTERAGLSLFIFGAVLAGAVAGTLSRWTRRRGKTR